MRDIKVFGRAYPQGSGNAIALAIRAGIEPQRITDIPFHPMVIRGTSIPIPYEVLSAGGRYRSESGDDIDPLANEGDAVIDLRFIEKDELTLVGINTKSDIRLNRFEHLAWMSFL